MSDHFEIDFLDVETKKSGDAISVRYEIGGETFIHVVDAGYQSTGEEMAGHIREHYANPTFIDNVVATHNDGDHSGGLRTVIEEFNVGALWMLRPWIYADEIIHRFSRYTSAENLAKRLREVYSNLAALEEIAIRRAIPIYEPFVGAQIGAFTVLAPTKQRFLDLVVESDRTPEHVESQTGGLAGLVEVIQKVAAAAVTYVLASWGVEVFSPNATSNENEMSVVQAATLNGKRILLTGDVGRDGLGEAADFAYLVGWTLPGVDRFQVPHHGSRRNVSTELLDRWLGERLPVKPAPGQDTFTAIISSAKADEHHPRKSVVRACIHRGAHVITTENGKICTYDSSPSRPGWGPVQPLPYPEDQEEQ